MAVQEWIECFEAHKNTDIILGRGRILVEPEMKSSCFSSQAIFMFGFTFLLAGLGMMLNLTFGSLSVY